MDPGRMAKQEIECEPVTFVVPGGERRAAGVTQRHEARHGIRPASGVPVDLLLCKLGCGELPSQLRCWLVGGGP